MVLQVEGCFPVFAASDEVAGLLITPWRDTELWYHRRPGHT